jgi:hypothetical protein
MDRWTAKELAITSILESYKFTSLPPNYNDQIYTQSVLQVLARLVRGPAIYLRVANSQIVLFLERPPAVGL